MALSKKAARRILPGAAFAFLAAFTMSAGASADDTRPTDIAGNLHFRSIGPSVAGGRLSSVVGTDQDRALYYIGAAGGGVFKSTNGGIDWTPVFDQTNVAPVGAIAISPQDKNVVWVGTGEPAPRNDVSYGTASIAPTMVERIGVISA